jgi:hypothetical protein
MIERVVLVFGVLALLVMGPAQASTPEKLLDELETLPGINVVQVNETRLSLCPATCEELSRGARWFSHS